MLYKTSLNIGSIYNNVLLKYTFYTSSDSVKTILKEKTIVRYSTATYTYTSSTIAKSPECNHPSSSRASAVFSALL